LKALVEEIVPVARDEVEAREALEEAEETRNGSEHAAGELGVTYRAADPDATPTPITER